MRNVFGSWWCLHLGWHVGPCTTCGNEPRKLMLVDGKIKWVTP